MCFFSFFGFLGFKQLTACFAKLAGLIGWERPQTIPFWFPFGESPKPVHSQNPVSVIPYLSHQQVVLPGNDQQQSPPVEQLAVALFL